MQAADPRGFCYAFKDYDGNPTNVVNQMDVDEFFKLFLDRFETKLGQNSSIINRLFKGAFCNELIPEGCDHRKQRKE